MHHAVRSFALAAAVMMLPLSMAKGQTAAPPGFKLKGEVNCAVQSQIRCRSDGCQKRAAPKGMEFNIDFDNKTACLKRDGTCGRKRPFRHVSSRNGYHALLVTSLVVTIIIAPDGKMRMFGPSGTSGIGGQFGQCGRG